MLVVLSMELDRLTQSTVMQSFSSILRLFAKEFRGTVGIYTNIKMR